MSRIVKKNAKISFSRRNTVREVNLKESTQSSLPFKCRFMEKHRHSHWHHSINNSYHSRTDSTSHVSDWWAHIFDCLFLCGSWISEKKAEEKVIRRWKDRFLNKYFCTFSQNLPSRLRKHWYLIMATSIDLRKLPIPLTKSCSITSHRL